MVDYRPCRRQTGKTLLLLLLMSFLGTGNAFLANRADAQAPQQPSQPPRARTTETATIVEPMPSVAISSVAHRFHFVIKSDTPLKELLPTPPKTVSRAKPGLVEDLAQVREIFFQEPLAKSPEALGLTAQTMAKINYLNKKKPDGFMEALLGERSDLAGLPIAMGDACQMKADRTQFFTQALNTIKQAKGQGTNHVNNLILMNDEVLARSVTIQQAQAQTKSAVPPELPTAIVPPSAPPALRVPPAGTVAAPMQVNVNGQTRFRQSRFISISPATT